MATAFADRAEAGRRLAERVDHLTIRPQRVLALPRGGVVVAAPIADRLGAPLDVVIVRKIGTPGHAELAMGALAMWGPHHAVVRNDHVLAAAGVDEAAFERARRREVAEALRRLAEWGPPDVDLTNTDVLLVDDGLATGATMHAAVRVLRLAGARSVSAAVPVGAPDELAALADAVDEVVCLVAPRPFRAVGVHYVDFGQVDDDTVTRVLNGAREASRAKRLI
jgi:putative phosphoribosyl transferase